MRKLLSPLLKLGISAGMVAFIVTRVDLAAMWKMVGSIGATSVAVAIGVGFVQNLLCAWRWMWIQQRVSKPIAFLPTLAVSYASMCIGQCLPSFVGGDAYRIYWLYHHGHAVAPAVRGVLLDRVSAFLALVLMLAAGVPWVLSRFHDAAALTAMWTVLLGGVGGAIALFSGDRLPVTWRRWRPLAELATLSATARVVLLTTSTGVAVTVASVCVHSLGALVMFLFARDLGLPIYLLDCLTLIPMLMLISAVPISIAGWGVREGVMVAALSLLGVRTEQALVLSVLLGCVALFNGLLGVFPLAFGDIRLSALRGPAAITEESALTTE